MPSCYGLDDMEAQVEAAYELEQSGIETSKIWFIFCRAEASEAEDQAARDLSAQGADQRLCAGLS